MSSRKGQRYTVHYQPIAGGTTNTICTEVVDMDGGDVIHRCISDAKRLDKSIRYKPDGKSKSITVCSSLKQNKHVFRIKVNGFLPWKYPFEIHAYTVGWQISTDLGKLALNIPGIEGVMNQFDEGMEARIQFEDQPELTVSCSHDYNQVRSTVAVEEHPSIVAVDEITFDELDWFHDAYPFSDSSAGVRIGFDTDLIYESSKFSSTFDTDKKHRVSQQYK